MTHVAEYEPSNTDEQYQEVKRRVYERWGIDAQSDDDADTYDVESLVASVEQKTGEAKEQIEAFVDSVKQQVAEKWAEAQASLEPKMAEADARAREFATGVSDGAKEKYSQAESQVREKPFASLAIAFGVGVAAGLVLGTSRRA